MTNLIRLQKGSNLHSPVKRLIRKMGPKIFIDICSVYSYTTFSIRESRSVSTRGVITILRSCKCLSTGGACFSPSVCSFVSQNERMIPYEHFFIVSHWETNMVLVL